ncbi:MAG: serine/threonine-protein kinase [Thermoplasmatota archaeon]
MATSVGDLYTPIVVVYHVAVALLIASAGRPNRVGSAALALMAIGAIQNLAPALDGVIWELGREWIDSAVLLTVAFLMTQTPGPLGGPRTTRLLTAAWGFGVTVLMVDVVFISLRDGTPLLVPRNVGFFLHEILFFVEAALLALVMVPRTLRLRPGPLRTQSLLLILAVGVGMAEQAPRFGAITWFAWDYIATYPLGPGWRAGRAAGYVGMAVFVALASLRLLLTPGRDNRIVGSILVAFYAIGVWAVVALVGTGLTHAGSRVPAELGFQIVRPILVAFAVLRYEFVVAPLPARRLLIPLSMVLAAFALFLGVMAALTGPAVDATAFQVSHVMVALALLVSLAYVARAPLGRVVTIATGGSPETERDARLQRYRLGLERAKMGDERTAAHLRERLGITDEEHDALAGEADVLVLPKAALHGAAKGSMVGGRYRVQAELGRGGQGRALLATDEEGQEVVLKEVLLMSRPPAAAAALEAEWRLLADVDHPGVARTLGLVRESWGAYLVRRYVPGRTLQDLIAQEGPMDGPALRRLHDRLAGALAALHDAGIAHLDVKPANIIIRPDGEAVLIDAGSGRSEADTDMTTKTAAQSPQEAMLTLRWAAPEQLLGGEVGPATDRFQLAGVIWFAATARPPVVGDALLDIQRQVTRPKKLAWPDHIDPALRQQMDALRAADPVDRPSLDRPSGVD